MDGGDGAEGVAVDLVRPPSISHSSSENEVEDNAEDMQPVKKMECVGVMQARELPEPLVEDEAIPQPESQAQQFSQQLHRDEVPVHRAEAPGGREEPEEEEDEAGDEVQRHPTVSSGSAPYFPAQHELAGKERADELHNGGVTEVFGSHLSMDALPWHSRSKSPAR